jgi:hypothetical protein
MAQSKGAQSKGASRTAGSGAGTVSVVLSAATAKDLLNALAQAVGTGSKRVGAKASPKAASKATSKAAPKAASRAASKASPKA